MIPMYQGAVFFDADGTLIDGPSGIIAPTEKTKEAIVRLRERNILTVLATGRSKCYVLPSLLLFDCYITANGARSEANGTVIHNQVLAPEALRTLVAYLDAAGINSVLEEPDYCYCRDLSEEYFQGMMQKYAFPIDRFLPLQSLEGLRINKLMVTYDRMDKRDRFMRDFGDRYDITDQPGNQACDVGQRGVSKGLGVQKVLEHFQIPKENAYAFGDADNDYEMFRAVGTGIAMSRHTPKLRQVSRMVTGTVQQEGIATALKELHLI